MEAIFWSHTDRMQQFLLKKLTGTFNTSGTTVCLETKITQLRVKRLVCFEISCHSTISVRQGLIQGMEMQEMCKKAPESVWLKS